MRQLEQAKLLVKKAAEDEDLLAEILSSTRVSDEIFLPELTTCVC